jgi:choice-of-anchor A domain-containing protein
VLSQLRKFVLPVAAMGGIAAASPAAADANVGLQVLREYNLFVLGNLTSSSGVDGRTFVGGNLDGNSSDYYKQGSKAPASSAPGLTVVGAVGGGTKNLQNGSGAYVGGSVGSGFNLNGQGHDVKIGGAAVNINGARNSTITVGGPVGGYMNANGATVKTNAGLPGFAAGLQVQANDYAMGVKDLSAYLAGLTPTDQISFPLSNRAQFKPTSNGNIAVFDLKSTNVFNSVGEIQFQPGAFDTIIINVGGTTAAMTKNFIGNVAGLGERVIWNFYEAQNINFTTGFYGSVLAPFAKATNSNVIEGSAVFGSLNQNGAVRLGGYNGSLAILSAVPEPATWAMMIAGFGLAGSMIRRRNRQALAAAA